MSFPKYNKPLLQKVLDFLEGTLITNSKTIVGAINELATIINNISNESSLDISHLILKIENIETILGDGDWDNVFNTGDSITYCLKKLGSLLGNIENWITKDKYNNIINAIDSIDTSISEISNTLLLLSTTKQDKEDDNIEDTDKNIVNHINAFIRKRLTVTNVNELFSKNLESGVYEVTVINNILVTRPPTLYILYVQKNNASRTFFYKLVGLNKIGYANHISNEFEFIDWDESSITSSINSLSNCIGDTEWAVTNQTTIVDKIDSLENEINALRTENMSLASRVLILEVQMNLLEKN